MAIERKVAVDKMTLRKWEPKKDKTSWGVRCKTPKYVIEHQSHRDNFPRVKSYAYSEIGAANKLAQSIINNHQTRIQLVCNPKKISEDLYYTADFMISHHNAYINAIDPVIDNNPFTLRRNGRVPQHLRTIWEA